MRIAIATDFYSPWIGGPATFIENFCTYLGAAGHQVTVLAPSPHGRGGVEHCGAFVVQRLPTLPMPVGYQLRVTARLDAVGAALAATEAQVVQIHHPFPLGFAALRAARQAGMPVVAVNHTIPECSLYGMRDLRGIYPCAVGAFRRYLIWFLQQADAVSTPTATAARVLRGMGFARPVEVISNGIDTNRFRPGTDRQEARAALGLPDKPIVLYTGRLDAEKDMPTWIRAAALALSEVDAHVVIGGEGNARPSLEHLVQELGIAAHTTFLGYLPAAQLPLLYQAADIYCMTSAVELQSISTLEALASGLPVVAANARALPELVRDGHNGYLCPPGDAPAFASALRALLHQPNLARVMGAAGRRIVAEHSLHTIARRHEQLLAHVAGIELGRARTGTL